MDVNSSVDIGTDFVGYRIEEPIGRGGMGVVYRAIDLRLKRPVALKLIAPSLALDPRFRERFARETELVMSLEHPNVIPIYDAGDVDGRLYLAMRLVDGTDLGSLLQVEGALAPARAVAVCTQIASALDAAHARGLVHRDVKPSNVLLDSTEHVYLADFGLTRRLDDPSSDAGEERSVGTPAYIAPEQLEGEPVDGRADVYSLGCLLYECLTGETVFPRASRLAVAWAHLEEEPPRPSRRRPGLPAALDDVIVRAMAKEPGRRYPTCAALVSAAEEALGLRKAHRLETRHVVVAGAALAAIVTAAAALVAALAGTSRDKPTPAAPLFAGPDTIARVDPTTNKVSAVIPVGAHPVVVAAGGHSVWVYNRNSASISEIEARANRVVKTTRISGSLPAECCSLFAGPVLAANASGAWFVDGAGRTARLAHVRADGGKKSEYRLGLTPTGVATGGGAVWVVGHRGRDYRLLRIDPATGRVTASTQFASRVDSIAFGFGAVYVMSSPPATIYRIDPRSARRTASAVVSSARATRPEIVPYLHGLTVRSAENGGTDVDIDPVFLTSSANGNFGPPGSEEYNGDLGALWWYDWPSGTVSRQQSVNGVVRTIHVTQGQTGGPCLTSMTAGSGSLWIAAAAGLWPNGGPCVR